MRTWTFAPFTRQNAAAVSRRTSLLTLGSAPLVAAAARPDSGAAKKKKSGADCKKKEKRRCTNDVTSCRQTIAINCGGDETFCAEALLCCDTCSANGIFNCLLALTE